MEGRWTIWTCRACGWDTLRTSPNGCVQCLAVGTFEPVPVVPCGDAAFEALRVYLFRQASAQVWPAAESCVEALRAAGETP